MFGWPAETAEAFDDARSYVGRRRIDHRIMVGEGNVTKELAVVIAIEGAPAAVSVLHAEQPLDAQADRILHALRIGMLHALQRHEHEGSVVHIREEIVAKLEGPASGFGVFVFILPVARAQN